MKIIGKVAAAMQEVLGRKTDALGRESGCIQRQRKFSGSGLLRTIVLTLLRYPAAKDRDYQRTAAQLGIDVTPEAIAHRFTSALVLFLSRVLSQMLTQVLAAPKTDVPLLRKFTQVLIGDSTSLTLPDALADQFPGCGGTGTSGKAALKIQVLWDLLTGRFIRLLLEPGRASDAKSPIVQGLPARRSLSILDLGYFSLERFRRLIDHGAYWISRWQHGTLLFDTDGHAFPLLSWLKKHKGLADLTVLAGEHERLRCRLIAVPVPQEVAARRRQKIREKAADHGRMASQEYLDLQGWTLFITNCESDLLTWKEVVVLYRARWQIELLFKLWKSHNHLAACESGVSPERHMAILYAKLIGVILQHWILLTAMWVNDRRSLRKAAATVREWIVLLAEVLDNSRRLCVHLQRLQTVVAKAAHVTSRRKHPSAFQLLENPELLEYTFS
jgi:hypothetical protein